MQKMKLDKRKTSLREHTALCSPVRYVLPLLCFARAFRAVCSTQVYTRYIYYTQSLRVQTSTDMHLLVELREHVQLTARRHAEHVKHFFSPYYYSYFIVLIGLKGLVTGTYLVLRWYAKIAKMSTFPACAYRVLKSAASPALYAALHVLFGTRYSLRICFIVICSGLAIGPQRLLILDPGLPY